MKPKVYVEYCYHRGRETVWVCKGVYPAVTKDLIRRCKQAVVRHQIAVRIRMGETDKHIIVFSRARNGQYSIRAWGVPEQRLTRPRKEDVEGMNEQSEQEQQAIEDRQYLADVSQSRSIAISKVNSHNATRSSLDRFSKSNRASLYRCLECGLYFPAKGARRCPYCQSRNTIIEG